MQPAASAAAGGVQQAACCRLFVAGERGTCSKSKPTPQTARPCLLVRVVRGGAPHVPGVRNAAANGHAIGECVLRCSAGVRHVG